MSEEEKKEEKVAKSVQVVAKPAKKTRKGKLKRRAAMPVKEKPKEFAPSSVRGKIEAIQREIEAIQIKRGEVQKGVADIHIGVRAMQARINSQIKKNQNAIAAFNTDIGKLYDSILAQVKENTKAAAAIFSGAREIQMGIRAIQSSISEKISKNAEYIKNFYG